MCEAGYKNFFSALKSFNNNIPEKELNTVKDIFNPLTIKKDHFFVKAGEIPNRIAFNVSGLFRYYYVNSEGVEFTTHFGLENNFVGAYSALLLNEKSKYCIEAMEDTKVLVSDFEDWENLLDSHIYWQMVGRKIAEKVYIISEKRKSRLLLEDAKTRYLKFLQEYPELEDRVRQYHIASYLGITPVTLSRIRAEINTN